MEVTLVTRAVMKSLSWVQGATFVKSTTIMIAEHADTNGLGYSFD
jgi:hypothetical protein